MKIELTEEEVTLLKALMAHHLAWATYKTENVTIDTDEKRRLLKDIDTLTLLKEKFHEPNNQ